MSSGSVGVGRQGVNPYVHDGKALVGKVAESADVKQDILRSVNLIGGFEKVIEPGDEVWLKPNYNSADAAPASSDPEFVKAVVQLLYEHGASRVIVGESSMQTLTTRKVMEKTGAVAKVKEAAGELVFFDEGGWVKVDVGGKYLKTVSLPEKALSAKKLVYVCCMKTHFQADFSMSLKLAFGFVKSSERLGFHLRNLQKKLVDLNKVVHPSLIIMDGRKCFIRGGPCHGEVRAPHVIVATADRVANDVEGVKIIESFEGSSLKGDPWDYPQISYAAQIGLGAGSSQEYAVVTG